MTSLQRALIGIGVLAVGFGAADIVFIGTGGFDGGDAFEMVLVLLGGWGFVGAGLFAWARRPDNRIGSIMVFTGFTWLIQGATAADNPVIFSIAIIFANLFAAALIHLLLAFPGGDLRTRADRIVVAGGYAMTTLVTIPVYVLTHGVDKNCDGCADFVFEITDSHLVETVGQQVLNVGGLVVLVAVLVRMTRRWRAASGRQRRILVPVYVTGAVVLATLTLSLSIDLLSLPGSSGDALFLLSATAFSLTPYVFLGGLVRSRVLRAGAVTDLISRLADAPEQGELRASLALALGDESLTLAYWIPGAQRYIDADGQGVVLPEAGSGRVVTPVERDGEVVAAIIHQALSDDDEDLVEAVGNAAALALDNERLEAELRSRLEELRASRTRIVEAGVTERRRLERDLHDGAQQRLVSLALTLRLARGKIAADPDGAAALLESSGEVLDLALAELRELARGIHPAILSDRGLGAALEALAGRAPLPVELDHDGDAAIPEAIESAAYFVVAEALTNVAKYSQASQARVAVGRENGHVVVEVSDDGIGGADPARGTGLRGLADRVAALDGRLDVASPGGVGTTISARIPCG